MAAVVSHAGQLFAWSADAPDGRFKIATALIEREFDLRDGVLRTAAIRNLSGKRTWEMADAIEFRLRLVDGRSFDARSFRVAAVRPQSAVQPHSVSFALVARDLPDLKITLAYHGAVGSHFLIKTVDFESPIAVERIDLEALPTSAGVALGGLGQPLFIGEEWFLGVEHPAGLNEFAAGIATCSLHPGATTRRGLTAVLGCADASDRRLDDAFRRYIDAFAVPVRPLLQYNSWFDLRGKELTPEKLFERFASFRRLLLDPHGLRLDALVIDDGFQDPKSLWEFNAAWDQRILPLREFVEQQGSRLGLWLPLSGHMLDTSFGAAKGYEISDHRRQPYCLGGARYRKDLQIAVASLLEAGNFGYFKHDFNFLSCAADGHGHWPNAAAGLEANVEGQLSLLDFEKAKQPDLARSLTTGIWLSPWWFRSAEFLWLGGADYGRRDRFPSMNARSAELTFRDIEIYRRVRIERAQAPLHRLMTHGLIRGKYDGMLVDERLADWSDYVVWFFARGTMLHELYLSPDDVPQAYWPVLGKAIRWARANADCFRWTRMVGGNPEAGEPYGFVHWSAEKGIVALRNPSTMPVDFVVPLESRPGHLPAVASWRPVVVYPARRLMPSTQAADRGVTLSMPSDSLTVVELFRELPRGLRSLASDAAVAFNVVDDKPKSASVTLEILAGLDAAPTVELASFAREKNHAAVELRTARSAAGDRVELRFVEWPAGGCRVAAAASTAPLAWERSRTADDGRAWRQRTAELKVDPTNPRLGFTVDLPPTPLYPEQCRVAATVRVLRNGKPRRVIEVPRDDLPEWPECVEGRGMTTEKVVLAEMEFFRRRSAAERGLWFALIVGSSALPFLALHWFLGRFNQRRWPRRLAAFGCFAGWASAVVWTPLGTLLGRVL